MINISDAYKYFDEGVQMNKAIFRMEYNNYYSDKEYRYIDYFTKWYSELKDYKAKNKFAAGIHFHFKKDGIKGRKIPNGDRT
ncbi:MAG TPA: hypothetical protein VJ111_12205 [Chitinophagaceae bacterium]|nr:hypothetical protein [Chitinophagaceae bacterium]